MQVGIGNPLRQPSVDTVMLTSIGVYNWGISLHLAHNEFAGALTRLRWYYSLFGLMGPQIIVLIVV